MTEVVNEVLDSIPSNITKILMVDGNESRIRYILGSYGLFVENIRSVGKAKSGEAPSIVTVKYNSIDDIVYFLMDLEDNSIFGKRVFSSMIVKAGKKRNIKGFIHCTSRHLLKKLNGKTIAIVCRDSELKQRFYETIFDMKTKELSNTESKFVVGLDYEKFDMKFVIKEYTHNGNYMIVTYIEGMEEGQ